MSVASYFFIGSADEASRNDGLGGGPVDRRAEFYRVMDTGLSPLYTAIAAAPCPRFEPTAMNEDYSQITFAFPNEFLQCLAAFNDAWENDVISRWQASGEAPYDNEGDLRALLAALVRLAKAARSAQQGMYLWNSL